MLKDRKIVLVVLAIATLLATGTTMGTAWARGDNVPQAHSQAVLGEEEVKQLILLLDEDKNGKVSKDEFLKFMNSEFDRLDADKSGELDVQELRESQLRVVHPVTFSSAGK